MRDSMASRDFSWGANVQTERDMSMEMESIRVALNTDRGVEWEKRVRALKKCCALARIAAVSEDAGLAEAFLIGLKALKRALAAQIGDLRSAVVREACEAISEMAETLGDAFGDAVADVVIPALLKTSAVTIQVVWESGAEAMRRTLHSSRIPPVVVAALTQCAGPKYATAMRSAVADYVGIILDRHPRSELDRSVESLEAAIRRGLCDAQVDVRRRSRKNFCIWEMMYTDRARALQSSLDSSTLKSIAEEKGEGDLAPSTRTRESHRRRRSVAALQPQTSSSNSRLSMQPHPPQEPQHQQQQPQQQATACTRPQPHALRARRVTTAGYHPKLGSAAAAAQMVPSSSAPTGTTPARPGRVPRMSIGNLAGNVADPTTDPTPPPPIPSAFRDWSARVDALDAVATGAAHAEASSVAIALRSVHDSLSDPHVRVVTAALRALAELIRHGDQADGAVERSPLLLARVLVRQSSPSELIREGVASVLAAVEDRLSREGLAATLVRILHGCRSGRLSSDVNGERSLPPVLQMFVQCFRHAAASSYPFEWRATFLESAVQNLAPLARAKSLEVRQGATEALRQLGTLTPPGAFQLALETADITDRITIQQLLPETVAEVPTVTTAAEESDDEGARGESNSARKENIGARNSPEKKRGRRAPTSAEKDREPTHVDASFLPTTPAKGLRDDRKMIVRESTPKQGHRSLLSSDAERRSPFEERTRPQDDEESARSPHVLPAHETQPSRWASLDRLLLATTTGCAGSAEAAWRQIYSLLALDKGVVTTRYLNDDADEVSDPFSDRDDSDQVAARICSAGVQSTSRFSRTSNASVYAQRAMHIVISKAPAETLQPIVASLLQCLDPSQSRTADTHHVALHMATLALHRVPDDELLESLVRSALPHIFTTMRHPRTDLRLAATEFLSYVFSRLREELILEHEGQIGPARMRLIARYVAKLQPDRR